MRGCPGGVPGGAGAVGTHTKKKRVQTWSETGQTQMLPCFCRSLEVMTARGRGCWTGGTLPPWESQGSPQGAPTPLRPPSVSLHLRKARCSSGCGSGGSGTGWSGSAGRAAGVTRGGRVPVPPGPRCPPACHLRDCVHPVVPLHQFVLRRHPVLPFPHPCGGDRWRLSDPSRDGDTQGHMPQMGTATPGAPEPWEPPKSGRSGFGSLESVGVLNPRRASGLVWVGRTRDAAPPAGAMPSVPGPMRGEGTGAQAGAGSAGSTRHAGSLLPEYPKEILEMGLR